MKKLYFLFAAALAISSADLKAQNCDNLNSFPFKETFEADSPSRSCWTQEVIDGDSPDYDGWIYKQGADGGVDYNIVNAHSGLLNACTQGFTPDSKVRLISPKMDITNLVTPTVSFFMGQERWGIFQNQLKVYYRISATSEWKLLKSYYANVPNWKQEILSLPEKSAQLQLCFEAIVKTGRLNVLDDIVVGNSDSVETDASGCAPSTPSNNFEGGSGDLSMLYLGNEFNVGAHINLTLTGMTINTLDKGGIESFNLAIMSVDDFGLPSEIVKSYENVIPDSIENLSEREGFAFRKNTFNLPEPLTLVGGAVGKRFWLVIKAVNKIPGNPSFMESTTKRNSGKEIYISEDRVQWQAVTNEVDGVFTLIGSCTETNPTDNYCTPSFNLDLAIDRVRFASIDNASTGSNSYEDFTSITSEVEQDKTYNLQVNAKTYDSVQDQAVTLFIDWNQDGYLGDEGEIYNIGKINEATGNTITLPVKVPSTAKLGNARMRVVSEYDIYTNFACNVFNQGQAEDYTLVVLPKQLSVSQTDNKAKTFIYPNPATDKVTVKSDLKLKKAEIFDLSGRKIMESATKEINLSRISTGQYLIKMTFENGTSNTQKLIKK